MAHPAPPDRKDRTMSQHPIRSFFDDVAASGEPPAAEVDALVADLTREGSLTNAAELRRRINETVTAVVAARDEGNAGRARSIARETSAELADQLGPYRPPPDDRPVREIVDGIQRSGFDPLPDSEMK